MKTHAYYRPIYRCYNGSTDAKECDGQTVYSAKKIEEAVLEIVRGYFTSIRESVNSVWREQAKHQMRSRNQAQIKAEERNLAKLQKQEEALKREVLKTLTGESGFDRELLQGMLAENREAIQAAEEAIAECLREKEREEARLQYLSSQYQNIRDWAEVFDDAGLDEQRMILSRIIERIDVDRNYHLTIRFFITMEDFQQTASNGNVSIVEVENCIRTSVG